MGPGPTPPDRLAEESPMSTRASEPRTWFDRREEAAQRAGDDGNGVNSPPRGAPRMSRLPASKRREQLLDCAAELFAKYGYAPATTAQPPKAAGDTAPIIH